MNEVLDKSIEFLVKRVSDSAVDHDQALKFTQAALNLANVKSTLSQFSDKTK